MEFIDTMPLWLVAVSVFALRILDVSLGTVRTVFVVQGHLFVAVLIGFFEVLIWVTAVSQVVARVHESPLLAIAFAAGFAAGNATGILLEQRLAVGTCILRMISREGGDLIAAALRATGHVVTTFRGEGSDGVRTLVYTSCPRREVPQLIQLAKGIEPSLFYVVDRFSQTGQVGPLPHPTGWRAVFKKK